MNIKGNLRSAAELGIGLTIIASLVLAGCGGGSGSSASSISGGASVSTNDLTITPMKGKFGSGTTVRVKRTGDLVEVASGVVDSTGSATVKVPSTEAGPFLIEAGQAGDTYFDESTGASAVVPANTVALRALVPDATSASAVGVTALTEMAVGQIEGASGIAAATATNVVAANTTIGNQFGVTNPLVPPTVIASGTKVTGGNVADDYALKLAGLAKMAASGVPALQALQDMRKDMADGKLDGLIGGTTPISTLKITVPAGGMSLAQMSTAIASQVQAATAQYANTGATVPTVTLTVQDLKALLSAAIQVGAQAKLSSAGTALSTVQLNAQIANTVQTQVATIATAVQAGSTVAAAQTVAVANAQTAGSVLANASSAAKNFLAALANGWYSRHGSAPSGLPIIAKEVGSGTGSSLTLTQTRWTWSIASNVWVASPKTLTDWSLTSTSTGGWVGNTATQNLNLTTNTDGTITYVNSTTGESGTFVPQEVALDGKPLGVCLPNSGVNITCSVADVYPAGSKAYEFVGAVLNNDSYWVGQNWNGGLNTDGSGVELTALPTLGADFCVNSHLFRAIPGAAAGADNYDVIYSYNATTNVGACSAANIATAKAATWKNGSVRVVSQATSNSAAPTVLRVIRVNESNPGALSWMKDNIFAQVGSKVYPGAFTPTGLAPAGWFGQNLNKTAMDANAAKAGATVALP